MKLTRRVRPPPGVTPGVLNALFGARTLLHPFTGASGFLRGVTGGGRVSESARRGGGKERKLRPSSLGRVRESRDIVAGRATRDAPQHDLEAAGLDLARLIAEFSVQDLAARHVLDIHRVTRARRRARCDCGESLGSDRGDGTLDEPTFRAASCVGMRECTCAFGGSFARRRPIGCADALSSSAHAAIRRARRWECALVSPDS